MTLFTRTVYCLALSLSTILGGCGTLLPTTDLGSDGGWPASGEDSFVARSDDTFAADAATSADGGTRVVDAAPAPFVFVPSSAAPTFVDDFARADGAVGNGWSVKGPGSFVIAGGSVLTMPSGVYDQPILFREGAAGPDVEVSADMTFGSNITSWQYLFARVQPISDQPGKLWAYGLQVNAGSVSLMILSSDGNVTGWGSLARESLESTLLVDTAYRLTLRVMGTDPVVVEGALSSADGTLIRSVKGTDRGSYRIVSAGRVGLGWGLGDTKWDDFKLTNL